LLLDEGIGAGDAAFLEKASRRLKEFTEKAAIIVLASHSEGLIRQMCDKAVLMEHGKVLLVGDTNDVLEHYRVASG
jgi:ABC-2 type transport system ATP-binding protein/lipopolysaccharide transport system ATP-binding protein